MSVVTTEMVNDVLCSIYKRNRNVLRFGQAIWNEFRDRGISLDKIHGGKYDFFYWEDSKENEDKIIKILFEKVVDEEEFLI